MGGVVHQLVFQLDAHNGPALLVGEALHLAVDFPVPQAGFLQVAGVVVPQGVGLLQQPVWEAAVAALAVGPGADAYHRLQARRWHSSKKARMSLSPVKSNRPSSSSW